MTAENTLTADGNASDLKSKAAELGRAAVAKIDAQRGSAASGFESAASHLHIGAENIAGGGQRAASFAHGAADKLSLTADYIRRNDINAMFEDVTALVKKNPVPALLGAAALGFVLSKAFSRRN